MTGRRAESQPSRQNENQSNRDVIDDHIDHGGQHGCQENGRREKHRRALGQSQEKPARRKPRNEMHRDVKGLDIPVAQSGTLFEPQLHPPFNQMRYEHQNDKIIGRQQNDTGEKEDDVDGPGIMARAEQHIEVGDGGERDKQQ